MPGDDNRAKRASRFVAGTSIEKPPNFDGNGITAMLLHPLCILLICVPLGIASHILHWGDSVTFWLNFAGLIPLAKILGDATEELAAGLHNDMLAGLLNATFGNAVEVVMMVQILRAGKLDVVKATLLGSVLSNLLLVLGCSFFFGGIMSSSQLWKQTGNANRSSMQMTSDLDRTSSGMEFVGEKVQTFSVMTAMVNTSLLLLSCLSLSLVTVFYSEEVVAGTHGHSEIDVITSISRSVAWTMIASYGAYVFFQLVTHREAMTEGDDEGDGEAEDAALSIPMSILVMSICTVIVGFSSELLVENLQEVVESAGISTHFIGIILLPIVGNACEHASAIRFAIQDKPGLSIGIAVGSSTQISLFVVPFSVIMGWMMNEPMDLNFGSLNTTVLSISVVVVLSIVVDGAATWLQGYLLISAYFIVAVLYWHLPDKMQNAI